MTEAVRYIVHMPITTCAICGDRSHVHVAVLGADGSYCRACATLAMLRVRELQSRHRAACWRTGVFSLTPQWKPAGLAALAEHEEKGK